MALFERISWNIPIAVLHMITPKNRQFLNEPTATTKAASIMLIRLKNVRQLSLNICFTDLLGILKSPFTSLCDAVAYLFRGKSRADICCIFK